MTSWLFKHMQAVLVINMSTQMCRAHQSGLIKAENTDIIGKPEKENASITNLRKIPSGRLITEKILNKQ